MNTLEIDNWIKTKLAKVQGGNEVNILDTDEVASKIAISFKEMRSDLENEDYSVIEPHWNLLMADWSPEEDGVYLLLGVNEKKLLFSIGRGDSWEIKDIVKYFDLNETNNVLSKLKLSKIEKERLEIDRSIGEMWLEYR